MNFARWANKAGWALPHELTLDDLRPSSATVREPQGNLPSEHDTEPDDGVRRLDLLRKLGGEVTRKKGDWRFVGISKLVKAEMEGNRPRASEKTIREDLRNAADAEADAKRSGAFVAQLSAPNSR